MEDEQPAVKCFIIIFDNDTHCHLTDYTGCCVDSF